MNFSAPGEIMPEINGMSALPFNIEKIGEVCMRNDVAMLGIFGSFARGDATDDSDVDLLVRFSKPKSLLGLVALERQIAMLIDRKIDLLTEAALSPYLRDRILREVRIIYEA